MVKVIINRNVMVSVEFCVVWPLSCSHSVVSVIRATDHHFLCPFSSLFFFTEGGHLGEGVVEG